MMIKEENIERLSDDIKYLKKWIKTYGIPSGLNSSTGLKFLEELIDIKKQKIEEWQAPPTDSVERSCDIFKIDDILEFNLKSKPHKRNGRLYRVKQVHNPKTSQHKHTYRLIGIHDGLSVETDGINYTLKLCCVDCSRIKLAEKYPHQSNLICQSCNGYDMYDKIKPKPLPTTPRPMTAIEIAQFIAKNGYVLCEVHGCDIQLFADIYIISGDEQSYESFRYLKPDSDKLYKFDEV